MHMVHPHSLFHLKFLVGTKCIRCNQSTPYFTYPLSLPPGIRSISALTTKCIQRPPPPFLTHSTVSYTTPSSPSTFGAPSSTTPCQSSHPLSPVFFFSPWGSRVKVPVSRKNCPYQKSQNCARVKPCQFWPKKSPCSEKNSRVNF